MEIYLIGAGGHAKQAVDIFIENGYSVVGAFDDLKKDSFYRNIPIIDKISAATKHDGFFFCTIGDNNIRHNILHMPLKWINCISKHSYISPTAKIGYGNYIGCHSRILADSIIGNGNIINDGATITHDNIIGDSNHIAPNASLGGRVRIGNLNLIGTNATINPDVILDSRIVIGSGCVVTKPIDEGIYVGVPARKL